MKLKLERGFEGETRDPAAVRTALQTLNSNDNTFAILSSDDETYIQTGAQEDGFIIERRDGSYNSHFYAARPGLHQPLKDRSWLLAAADVGQDRFTLDEVIDIFSAYLSGVAPHTSVQWVRMNMPDPQAFKTKVSSWARVAVWAILFAAFAGVVLWLSWKRYHP
jgi:hypothetical protein